MLQSQHKKMAPLGSAAHKQGTFNVAFIKKVLFNVIFNVDLFYLNA
jgi:hypothetical protein